MASFTFSSFICIAVLSCLSLAEPGYGWSPCSAGWEYHNRRCFKYFPRKTTWFDAEKCCKSFGGHLASAHSERENQFLQAFQKRNDRRRVNPFWIGLSDLYKEGKFIWSDGHPVRFTLWAAGQPDNYNGHEHCVHTNFGVQKKWNDCSCDHALPFICAKRMFY